MRKLLLIFLHGVATAACFCQNVQMYYDLRHSVDPTNFKKNFPALSFEYFRDLDSVGTGSFLFRLDTQLSGEKCNMGQAFAQVSQSLRFWKPKPGLSVYYSGGLGVVLPGNGFFITNAVGMGSACPFQWRGAWISIGIYFRASFYARQSYDPQLILYFGKGFHGYRIFTDGSFVFWTENRNQGSDYTRNLSGKKFAFFGDPKVWIKISGGLSAGIKTSVFYNLTATGSKLKIYPAIGTRYRF
ncbi:MAG TPA: hypothetical protein VMT63_07525 [Bacteroidales bacterium]|nr:hypothetical protein [Bacteroidales bacterium]